jgi:hypothetical protein
VTTTPQAPADAGDAASAPTEPADPRAATFSHVPPAVVARASAPEPTPPPAFTSR